MKGSDIALSVENLSKQYCIGVRRDANSYGTLREALMNAASAQLKRIYRRIDKQHIENEYFWALKDLSFQVKWGHVLGIIGKNGAGKSTLLKILSRITSPTTGSVEIHGHISSLLEVGTGFHPELTGRENIYLNGAILGMRRADINHKLDEIVDFAEIDKFIDMPVKRYSSGMYVRLAFAVAAQLEPDILVIDEVLAVGDAAFQKKCLAKMGEAAGGGRTVLFVSHNMSAIKRLCDEAIILDQGRMILRASAAEAVENYLGEKTPQNGEYVWNTLENIDRQAEFVPLALRVLDNTGVVTDRVFTNNPIIIEIEYSVNQPFRGLRVGIYLSTGDGQPVFASWDIDDTKRHGMPREPGHYISRCEIPPDLLNIGRYTIGINAGVVNVKSLFTDLHVLSFLTDGTQGFNEWGTKRWGALMPLLDWEIKRVN